MADKDELGFEQEDVGFEAEGGEAPAKLSLYEKAKLAALAGLGTVGKATGYVEGISTGALTGLALEKITGKDVFNGQEYTDALNPTNLKQFPTLDEQLARAEVPKGVELSKYWQWPYEDVTPGSPADRWYIPNKGGALDPSVRGTLSEVGSALRDPLTWLSGGSNLLVKGATKTGSKALLKGANIVNKAVRAPRHLTEKAGTKLFAQGISPIVEAAGDVGKKQVAETFLKHNIVGPTAGGLRNQINAKAKQLKGEVDDLLNMAGDSGTKVSRREMQKPLTDELKQLIHEGRIGPRQAVQARRGLFEPKLKTFDPSPAVATKWKTDMGRKLPANHWDELKAAALKDQLTEKAQTGVRKATEKAMGEKGAEIAAKNAELGTLLSSRKAARRMAKGEGNPFGLDWGDFAAFGAANPYSQTLPLGGIEAVLAKRLLQTMFLKPGGQRATGWFLHNLGKNPASGLLIDASTRQMLKPPSAAPEEDLGLELEE